MSIFKFIPGILWLDVLDKVTDQCHTFLGWRLPCSLMILFAWMSLLGEVRIQAVNAVKYITVVYYRPNKYAIKKFYGQWQARLAICAIMCGLSYYFTFEFADDFPYLQALKESIQNEGHNKKIENAEKGEEFLMAHVYAQRFLQQVQALVWILGTLLRLNRKRFLKLAALVWMMKPLCSTLVAWCGNYALWLFIGHTLLRAFDLAPEGYPRFGSVGCYTAVFVSTIYWRKYGTLEIILAVSAAVGAEILWRNAVQQVQDERVRRAERPPRITDRIWNFFASIVAPEDEGENKAQKDGEKTQPEEVTPPYTRPSLYSWMAIAIYWAAVGIHLDGYDLLTF